MVIRVPLSAIDFEPPAAIPPPTTSNSYPGSSATPAGLLLLAGEYRQAAGLLMGNGRKGVAASYAPFRLNAIHAIELYLSSFLLSVGEPPEAIRALGHDLAARSERAVLRGLVLRQRTILHMRSLSGAREYLVSRYAVELLSSMSQLNQLSATLEEVASKVTRRMQRA